jgi:hypothetical protein
LAKLLQEEYGSVEDPSMYAADEEYAKKLQEEYDKSDAVLSI